MNRKLPRALATVAFLAPALSLGAQKVVNLPKPDAEYAEPFTQINSVRELMDGRVLVADTRDKTVLLIDFRSGNTTKVGREGSGPGEYALPSRLVALPLDTSAIYDPLNSRYVLVGPDGKAGKEFRLEQSVTAGRGGGRMGGMMVGGQMPRGTDARGRIYYEGSGLSFSPDGAPSVADSAGILRYDRATKTSDTVAWVHLPPNNTRVSGGRGNMNIMIGATPFAARDDWAVLQDGGVAVVRVADYHVDWYSPSGARRAGAPVKFDRIAVSEGDKEEWRNARKGAVGMTVRVEGAVTTRGAGPIGGGVNLPDPEWPQFKPPFAQGGVFARPNGEVWVLRSRKAGDKVPKYDVFAPSGAHLGQVALPASTRLVGFGRTTIYTVRVDEDDLQFLQRRTLKEGPVVP